MGILDIFKKRKKAEEKKEKKVKLKKEIKRVKPVERPKTTTLPPPSRQRQAPKVAVPKKERKIFGEVYRILKIPHVTEKATYLAGKNQYVFKVFPKTNKAEIKKAIEGLYGVEVISVKIIKVPKKRRRLGGILGWRKGYKKAIVKIKKGQKIEVLPR